MRCEGGRGEAWEEADCVVPLHQSVQDCHHLHTNTRIGPTN